MNEIIDERYYNIDGVECSKDDPLMVAYFKETDTSKNHYIMIGNEHKDGFQIYDPVVHGKEALKLQDRFRFKPFFNITKVNALAFINYKQYLITKNKAFYRMAERERV